MSDNSSNQGAAGCRPACEGESLIVEVMGKDHPEGNSLRIISTTDQEVNTEIDGQKATEDLEESVLHKWPWSDAVQGDVALEIATESGNPVRVPLYSNPGVTKRALPRQKLLMMPFVPLTLIGREQPQPGVPEKEIVSARTGYLYLFRNDKLWREIRITQDSSDSLQFRDVALNDYRRKEDGSLADDTRLPASVGLSEIWIPASYSIASMSYRSDVRVAWSEVQWSAARIGYLESDRSALKDRTQRILQRPDARWHKDFAELVSLDEVKPQRCRQPMVEEQLPCACNFLTDLSGSYGQRCYNLAKEEQELFFAGGEQASDAWRESQYNNTELGHTAAIRAAVLEDYLNEQKGESGSSREMWEAIGESEDIFDPIRQRYGFGVVVYDELYEMRRALARANVGIRFQQAVRQWTATQPHYQSAELLEQTILPEKLGGQDNPLNEHAEHIDLSPSSKFEQSLHRAYRALAINATKAAQKQLLAVVDDAHNQSRLADLFSLEGGDYLSGFVLSGGLFSALQYDPEVVDKPWLAGSNPDCSIGCIGALTQSGDNPSADGSQFVLDIAKEGSSHPLHGMLFPKLNDVPVDDIYHPVEDEHNAGDGLFRPAAYAALDKSKALPEQQDLQTLEAASVLALTEQGAYDFAGAARSIIKALDSVSGLLMEQVTKAQQRLLNGVIRIELDIHGPMVRALKAMNPTMLGELHLMPYRDRGQNMVLIGVEDPEIGLRNGLTEVERDYHNRNNLSGRFLGEIQDSEGRIIGSTNPNRIPGGVDLDESGRFIAFMAPAGSELVRNHREVRQQISRQRSLGKTLDRLGLPYVVLGVEIWNLNNVANSYDGFVRERGESFAGWVRFSARMDLMVASIAVLEQVSKKVIGSELLSNAMNYVVFDVRNAAVSGVVSQNLASTLPRAVTVRIVSVSLLAALDAGIRMVDAAHYVNTGQVTSAAAMGVSAVGSLMTAWATISLMSGGSATGAGAVLGLGALSGGLVLGIGLILAIGGGVAAGLLEDSDLESWLKNGPFGEHRSRSREHLWGKSMEQEAFYRLSSILAGVRVEESLHRLSSAKAYQLADAKLRELADGGERPSRREVIALQQELEKVNFRIVVKSNLMTVMDDASLKVHIRRLFEQRRPNPPSGGTIVTRSELQESPGEHWWIYRQRLPDGFEYWLHTPRPEGLSVYEWKVRARLVASLGTGDEYVFPAPPVNDSLIFNSDNHGGHDEPDFARDKPPFWASLTTNVGMLKAKASRDSRRALSEGANVG